MWEVGGPLSVSVPAKELYCEITCEITVANYLESGGSSVVTRWTIDQEVVGSNPTHGGNLISVVRSLSGFTQPIR